MRSLNVGSEKSSALSVGLLGREDGRWDAAQETFIAAYRNLANFRGEAKVSSWLHRIAVNQCLTVKRRAKTRSEEFLDDDESSSDRVFIAPLHNSPSRKAEQFERLKLVRSTVGSLPTDLRQVVVMKEFEDMTFQGIFRTRSIYRSVR